MIAAFDKEYLDRLGITYDTAIPQEIFNKIYNTVGKNPSGDVVTVYPFHGSPGLLPVTVEGSLILWEFALKYGESND